MEKGRFRDIKKEGKTERPKGRKKMSKKEIEGR